MLVVLLVLLVVLVVFLPDQKQKTRKSLSGTSGLSALTLRSVANGYLFVTRAACPRMRVARDLTDLLELRLLCKKLPRRPVDRFVPLTIPSPAFMPRCRRAPQRETVVVNATASDKMPRTGACLLTCRVVDVFTAGS